MSSKRQNPRFLFLSLLVASLAGAQSNTEKKLHELSNDEYKKLRSQLLILPDRVSEEAEKDEDILLLKGDFIELKADTSLRNINTQGLIASGGRCKLKVRAEELERLAKEQSARRGDGLVLRGYHTRSGTSDEQGRLFYERRLIRLGGPAQVIAQLGSRQMSIVYPLEDSNQLIESLICSFSADEIPFEGDLAKVKAQVEKYREALPQIDLISAFNTPDLLFLTPSEERGKRPVFGDAPSAKDAAATKARHI